MCLKPATKLNVFRHHAMLLACSYDALSMSHDPFKAIDGIRSVLKLKGNIAAVPVTRLGGGISEVENPNGTKCETMTSEKCAKAAAASIEEKLSESGCDFHLISVYLFRQVVILVKMQLLNLIVKY